MVDPMKSDSWVEVCQRIINKVRGDKTIEVEPQHIDVQVRGARQLQIIAEVPRAKGQPIFMRLHTVATSPAGMPSITLVQVPVSGKRRTQETFRGTEIRALLAEDSAESDGESSGDEEYEHRSPHRHVSKEVAIVLSQLRSR